MSLVQIMKSNARQYLSVAVLALAVRAAQVHGSDTGGHILIGQEASATERYAARELQRYLYQLSGSLLSVETAKADSRLSGRVFVLGTSRSNPLIAKLAEAGEVRVSAADPGPQGYVLKKIGRASSTSTLANR